MSPTTLNYTSTAGDPALDATFEAALARAREGRPEPLTHLIGGRQVAANGPTVHCAPGGWTSYMP